MDQCLDDIEYEDDFDALMYTEFPDDEEEEETDPILASFIEDMDNIERIGNALMGTETRGGWHLDAETGEYRRMQVSINEARRPYVMRAIQVFERTGIFI